jgi:hypothetical protein
VEVDQLRREIEGLRAGSSSEENRTGVARKSKADESLRRAPRVKLAVGNQYHVFLSHHQAKAGNTVHALQLLLQALRLRPLCDADRRFRFRRIASFRVSRAVVARVRACVRAVGRALDGCEARGIPCVHSVGRTGRHHTRTHCTRTRVRGRLYASASE